MDEKSCFICRGIEDVNQLRRFQWELEPGTIDYVADCERCGRFKISRELVKDTQAFEDDEAFRLSKAARDNTDRRDGWRDEPPLPKLTRENWRGIATAVRVTRSYSDLVDAIVRDIGHMARYPGRPTPPFSLIEEAARVCLPLDALQKLLGQISAIALLEIVRNDPREAIISLLPKGWERLDALGSGSRGDRAFVAMWFDPSMNEAYQRGIETALLSCGYHIPFRVDDPLHDESINDPDYRNRIDDRILAEIRRARFVVADVTGARNSVYYEAGFADGLGIPVIWCCRQDEETKMAFDTRQFGYIIWSSPENLAKQLEDKIRRRGWALRAVATT